MIDTDPNALTRKDQLRALALTQAGSLPMAKEMYKFLLGEGSADLLTDTVTVEEAERASGRIKIQAYQDGYADGCRDSVGAFNDGFSRGQNNMLDKLYNALQGRAMISTDANWISDVIQQLRFEVR